MLSKLKGYNTITACCHTAAGLSNNKTLQTLDLNYCRLTDKCVKDLFSGLNSYLKELNIGGNDSITENGLGLLSGNLTTLSGLRCLRIPHHLESSINTVFSEINEQRKNGLPMIEMT